MVPVPSYTILLPEPWSTATEKSLLTPLGETLSVGTKETAEVGLATTILLAPLPPVKLTTAVAEVMAPMLVVEAIVGSLAKVAPDTAWFSVIAPVRACVIVPECGPAAPDSYNTSSVVEPTVPDEGVKFIVLLEKAATPVLILKFAGGVITISLVKSVPETVYDCELLCVLTAVRNAVKLPDTTIVGVDAAVTLNVLLVPAVSTSPEVRVAVIVAPEPALAKVTPLTTIELVPIAIVPVVVPPIAPAFPLVDKVKPVAAETLLSTLLPSLDSTVIEKGAPAT